LVTAVDITAADIHGRNIIKNSVDFQSMELMTWHHPAFFWGMKTETKVGGLDC
jgi:hypothetical protein